jgi:hypothetical protein
MLATWRLSARLRWRAGLFLTTWRVVWMTFPMTGISSSHAEIWVIGVFTVDSNGSFRGCLKNCLRNLGVCGQVQIGTETELKQFQLWLHHVKIWEKQFLATITVSGLRKKDELFSILSASNQSSSLLAAVIALCLSSSALLKAMSMIKNYIFQWFLYSTQYIIAKCCRLHLCKQPTKC